MIIGDRKTLSTDNKNYHAVVKKRYRKRQKLKIAVANFTNRLQYYRSGNINATTMRIITMQLQKILNLPYCWTDKDLERAFHALTELEKKYLQQTYVNASAESVKLKETLLQNIQQSKISQAEKTQVALEVLQDAGRDLLLQEGDKLEPTPENALILLTQNMDYTVPDWYHKALLDLLTCKFKGKDKSKFISKLNKRFQKDLVNENYQKTINEILEKEITEDIIIDKSFFK